MSVKVAATVVTEIDEVPVTLTAFGEIDPGTPDTPPGYSHGGIPGDPGYCDVEQVTRDDDGQHLAFLELPVAVQQRIEEALWDAYYDSRWGPVFD